MRSVDERVAAVQNRSKKLRRKRDDRTLAIVVFLTVLPLLDLAGLTVAGSLPEFSSSSETLFGAASMFGSSVGGYVLVGVVSFALAVLITVFVMLRRRSAEERDMGEAASCYTTSLDDESLERSDQ